MLILFFLFVLENLKNGYLEFIYIRDIEVIENSELYKEGNISIL